MFQTRATDSQINDECYGGNGEDISWPRVVIFPEGTTTNAKTLIQFKAGAFRVSYPITIQIQKMSLDFPKCIMYHLIQAGTPVQPVVIRNKNQWDTLTYTLQQSFANCFWTTFCQFSTKIEVRYTKI